MHSESNLGPSQIHKRTLPQPLPENYLGNLTLRKHCKLTTCHVNDAGAAVTPTTCGLGYGEANAGFEIRELPMENNGLPGIL